MIFRRHRLMITGILIGLLLGLIDFLIEGFLEGASVILESSFIVEHFVVYPLIGLVLGFGADRVHSQTVQLRLREKQLATLNHASSRVSRWGLSLDGVLQAIVSSLVEDMEMAFARIWLADASEQELILKASAGLYTRLDGSRSQIRLADYPYKLTQIAVTRQPLVANRIQEDDRFDQGWAKEQNLVAFAGYPLSMNGHLIAVLAIFSHHPLDNSILNVLGSFANQVSVAIENARLYHQLQASNQTLEQAVAERTVELKRQTEQTEAILRSAADAIFIGDLKGTVLAVNPAFEQQTGYHAGEIVGERFRVLAPPSLSPALIEEDRAAIKAGRPWRHTLPIRRKDGSQFDAEVNRAPLYEEDGTVRRVVVVMRDVSAQKELERLKDQFVSNVSHELRTPITSIKLYLSLVERKPEQTSEYLLRLHRETQRLEHTIEDLLDLSRLDGDRVEIGYISLDLNGLIETVVSDRLVVAENRGLSLRFDPQPGLPDVRADPTLLSQVLSILLTNALNYTPSGGKVVINTRQQESQGKQWVGFRISDSGPGIAPDEQGHLFERFYRGSAGRQSAESGTGLGLAIAREIMERHQGRIELASDGSPEGGAAFDVWLPVSVP